MRTALPTADNAVVGYPVTVAYPDPLPSPVPGFSKLDQVPAVSTGYWPGIPSRDMPPNVAGHNSGPDLALPDFSKWLATAPYPSSDPAVSHAAVYASFEPTMTDSVPVHPSSHAPSPLYSLIASESHCRSPMIANTMSPDQPQMMVPHPLSHAIDHPPLPPQQLKQASPLLLQQQQTFGQSTSGNSSLLQPAQTTSETALLPQHMKTEYHLHNPIAVCFSLKYIIIEIDKCFCRFCFKCSVGLHSERDRLIFNSGTTCDVAFH